LALIALLKNIIVNLIGRQVELDQFLLKISVLDEFVLMTASQMLHLLHDYFALKEYIDPGEWNLHEFDWKKVTTQNFFTP
jgi:hypothetical protein